MICSSFILVRKLAENALVSSVTQLTSENRKASRAAGQLDSASLLLLLSGSRADVTSRTRWIS